MSGLQLGQSKESSRRPTLGECHILRENPRAFTTLHRRAMPVRMTKSHSTIARFFGRVSWRSRNMALISADEVLHFKPNTASLDFNIGSIRQTGALNLFFRCYWMILSHEGKDGTWVLASTCPNIQTCTPKLLCLATIRLFRLHSKTASASSLQHESNREINNLNQLFLAIGWFFRLKAETARKSWLWHESVWQIGNWNFVFLAMGLLLSHANLGFWFRVRCGTVVGP